LRHASLLHDQRRTRLAVVARQGNRDKDDAFQALASVTVLPLTSELHEWPQFRITIHPTRRNGLRQASQISIDKAGTIPRAKIGQHIGRVDAATMRSVETALARFLGLR